jgi:hypothetical protein
VKKNTNIFLILAVLVVVVAGFCIVLVLAGALLLPAYRNMISVQRLVTPPPAVVTAAIVPIVSEVPSQVSGSETLPVSPPTTIPPTTEAPPTISYEGISFTFGSAIAQIAQTEIIPAAPGDPNNSFPGDVHPQYYQFSFNGYPLANTFHQPKIFIYPARDYGSMDPSVAQIILKLQQVLAQKITPTKDIPFLPLWNAGQMLSTKVKFVEFKNGSGVRFLSQYGQSFAPINNIDLFYTFQGLTSDGAWYVAAILPVSNPILPNDDQTVPNGDWDTFGQNFTTYITDISAKLDSQPDSSFTPDLSFLDQMIQSMQIK